MLRNELNVIYETLKLQEYLNSFYSHLLETLS